jgi:hypothetical protein
LDRVENDSLQGLVFVAAAELVRRPQAGLVLARGDDRNTSGGVRGGGLLEAQR